MIFDYIYYRIARFYHKWDGNRATTAVSAVSLLETLYIGLFFMGTLRSFINILYLRPYTKLFGAVGMGIFLFILIFNINRYKNIYVKLNFKWQRESIFLRFAKGVGIAIFSFLPIVGFIFLGGR